jgi:hypothetical protein
LKPSGFFCEGEKKNENRVKFQCIIITDKIHYDMMIRKKYTAIEKLIGIVI